MKGGGEEDHVGGREGRCERPVQGYAAVASEPAVDELPRVGIERRGPVPAGDGRNRWIAGCRNSNPKSRGSRMAHLAGSDVRAPATCVRDRDQQVSRRIVGEGGAGGGGPAAGGGPWTPPSRGRLARRMDACWCGGRLAGRQRSVHVALRIQRECCSLLSDDGPHTMSGPKCMFPPFFIVPPTTGTSGVSRRYKHSKHPVLACLVSAERRLSVLQTTPSKRSENDRLFVDRCVDREMLDK